MKAWLLDEFSSIGHLRLAEVPDPIPQKAEAILEVHYAALNPADRYLAEAQYPAKPPLPHILGRDGMGAVAQMGSEVNGLHVGDQRAVLRGPLGVERPGTFAQRVAAPLENLVEVPAGWSAQETADVGTTTAACGRAGHGRLWRRGRGGSAARLRAGAQGHRSLAKRRKK